METFMKDEKIDKLKRISELKKKAKAIKYEAEYFSSLQLALKLIMNGEYGALATPYFVMFNNKVAASITAQGRELTRKMSEMNEDYWYNHWHLDYELHKKLSINNVKQINGDYVRTSSGEVVLEPTKAELSGIGTTSPEVVRRNPVSIYADTDSCDANTIINTDSGDVSIEDMYNRNMCNGSAGVTNNGHESVITNDKVLNYDNGSLYYADVSRIIRHKVSKDKWKLRTKSGREVIVTNDHSMIVFRNGEQIEVKPSDIEKTDKILVVKKNIYR